MELENLPFFSYEPAGDSPVYNNFTKRQLVLARMFAFSQAITHPQLS